MTFTLSVYFPRPLPCLKRLLKHYLFWRIPHFPSMSLLNFITISTFVFIIIQNLFCNCNIIISSALAQTHQNLTTEMESSCDTLLSLESIRKSLIREEDIIIFSLVERAKYPTNSPLYHKHATPPSPGCTLSDSLFRFFLKQSEAVQAKAGRYISPEENAFFPDDLPPPLLPPSDCPPVLHSPGNSININKKILDLYLHKLLPLFTSEGDDGRYAVTAASDVNCLQALSRRIHYGKFVAEVKFRDAPEDYIPAIRAKDREALMNLLTFTSVEEAIKKRVEKKTMIFGQDVDDLINDSKYKINPSVVSQLYGEWVIPLTKFVQVEYLLRRLD